MQSFRVSRDALSVSFADHLDAFTTQTQLLASLVHIESITSGIVQVLRSAGVVRV